MTRIQRLAQLLNLGQLNKTYRPGHRVDIERGILANHAEKLMLRTDRWLSTSL